MAKKIGDALTLNGDNKDIPTGLTVQYVAGDQITVVWIDRSGKLNEATFYEGMFSGDNEYSPIVIVQPTTPNVLNYQDNLTLSVEASGTAIITYLWHRDGSDITTENVTGMNTPNLIITSATIENEGNYDCTISNEYGEVVSEKASILIKPYATIQPQDTMPGIGDPAEFMFGVEASTDLNYQWYYNGEAMEDSKFIENSNGNPLTITNSQTINEGYYYCIASSEIGEVTSNIATLTIT